MGAIDSLMERQCRKVVKITVESVSFLVLTFASVALIALINFSMLHFSFW